MSEGVDATLDARLDTLYREESRAVLATLIRLLGDFDLAEEAVQDAFTTGSAMSACPGPRPTTTRCW